MQAKQDKGRGLLYADIGQVLVSDVVQPRLKGFLAEFFFHYHYNSIKVRRKEGFEVYCEGKLGRFNFIQESRWKY